MKKIILLVAFLLTFAQSCFGALVGIGNSNIVQITSYENYGGGDVIIYLSPAPTGCEGGVWLNSQADLGFKQSLAVFMQAYSLTKQVVVSAYDDQIWGGSSTRFCRLYSAGF